MALRTIELSPSALSDLEELLACFAGQGVPETGRRIAVELMDAVHTLPQYPEMGGVVPEFDAPSLRELIRPPYRVVYRLDADRIAILRIWRSERLLMIPTEGGQGS